MTPAEALQQLDDHHNGMCSSTDDCLDFTEAIAVLRKAVEQPVSYDPHNLEWVQSAVDYAHDATIQNAWSEIQAELRQLHSMVEDAKTSRTELEAERDALREQVKAAREALQHVGRSDVEEAISEALAKLAPADQEHS